jgi:hypothetical protein
MIYLIILRKPGIQMIMCEYCILYDFKICTPVRNPHFTRTHIMHLGMKTFRHLVMSAPIHVGEDVSAPGLVRSALVVVLPRSGLVTY